MATSTEITMLETSLSIEDIFNQININAILLVMWYLALNLNLYVTMI
jgi:hypothetical protein